MPARASRPRPGLALAAVLVLLAAGLGACSDVAIPPDPTPAVGDGGDLVVEDRTDGPVERVSVSADITVMLSIGEPTSVTVRAEENILPFVETETVDGQLIVNVPFPGFTTQQRPVLTVRAPTLTSVTMSGGADGSLELVADSLRLDLSAAASLIGVGRVEQLRLTSSSDGAADLEALTAGDAEVTMSGGSQATLAVEGRLSGVASGGATITLTQTPATVEVETSTGASVQGPG